MTTWTFVGKVMSLVFNTLSSFVIAFLPRSKCLLILWLQSLSTVILEDVNYILRVWTRQNLKTDDIDPYWPCDFNHLKAWTMSSFAQVLWCILLCSSLCTNIYAPPKPLHEYVCNLTLKIPQFCWWGRRYCLGKIHSILFICCKK